MNVIFQNSKDGIKQRSLGDSKSDLEILTWVKATKWLVCFWGQYCFLDDGEVLTSKLWVHRGEKC